MALSLELTDIFNCRFFVNRFPVCFNPHVRLFLVTPYSQFPAVLVTFTEEILKGKLYFLCGVYTLNDIPQALQKFGTGDSLGTKDGSKK